MLPQTCNEQWLNSVIPKTYIDIKKITLFVSFRKSRHSLSNILPIPNFV